MKIQELEKKKQLLLEEIKQLENHKLELKNMVLSEIRLSLNEQHNIMYV